MTQTALLVLDFINDIVHPDGKIAASAPYVKENHVIENANRAIQFARDHKIPVVLVKVGFSATYAECPATSPIFGKAKQFQALQLGTWGTEFHESLKKDASDFVVVKPRVSALYATSLEAFLRANAISHLLICGVSTDMAVQTTARDAHDRDYRVTILADACGAGSKEAHASAIQLLQRLAAIVNVADLKSEMVS